MCVCVSLHLDIDDHEIVISDRMQGRVRLSTGDSPQYFGGVPDDYTLQPSNVGSETPFIGCISDVVINDKLASLSVKSVSFRRSLRVYTYHTDSTDSWTI